MTRRALLTDDEVRADKLRLAALFGVEWARREAETADDFARTYKSLADTYQQLRMGDYLDRGEKWSFTYHERKNRRYAHLYQLTAETYWSFVEGVPA